MGPLGSTRVTPCGVPTNTTAKSGFVGTPQGVFFADVLGIDYDYDNDNDSFLMRTDQFDYDLPEALIAQQPALVRDQARMMVVRRDTQTIEHRRVFDLPEYLVAPDLLVVNDTRVIPARLLGVKGGTGGQIELLLLEAVEGKIWDVLMRCGRRPKPGARFFFGGGRLQAVLLEDGERGKARVRFEAQEPLLELFENIGVPPLPPYISRKGSDEGQVEADRERYQTIYASEPGSVAAPTAGLHFTPELFERLAQQGVRKSTVTLHVGLGTFRPVQADEVEAHEMESERYRVPAETAQDHRAARAAGGRVVAVGSTTVRTLETVAQQEGEVVEHEGRSSLYIYPPFEFKAIDALLTNFHLPKSTLLMMVCAFGGQNFMLEAYRTAVQEQYRFYSYGDCMLIL